MYARRPIQPLRAHRRGQLGGTHLTAPLPPVASEVLSCLGCQRACSGIASQRPPRVSAGTCYRATQNAVFQLLSAFVGQRARRAWSGCLTCRTSPGDIMGLPTGQVNSRSGRVCMFVCANMHAGTVAGLHRALRHVSPSPPDTPCFASHLLFIHTEWSLGRILAASFTLVVFP